jgi:hypothetical protein
MGYSASYIPLSDVFADPSRYHSALAHCNVQTPNSPYNWSDLVFPTSGKFDFICLQLFNITTTKMCEDFTGRPLDAWGRYPAIDIWTRIVSRIVGLILNHADECTLCVGGMEATFDFTPHSVCPSAACLAHSFLYYPTSHRRWSRYNF